MPKGARSQSERSERRRLQLKTQIAAIDHALPGSINVVMNRCGKPNCACHAEPPKLHGPYVTWTRKIEGKTVTRRLTPEQLERYEPWFENSHRLRELIGELHALSTQDAERAEGWGRKGPSMHSGSAGRGR
ncbi:MAG TPA: DUF6788 family protein [Solirubrobacteraceae bacterium]